MKPILILLAATALTVAVRVHFLRGGAEKSELRPLPQRRLEVDTGQASLVQPSQQPSNARPSQILSDLTAELGEAEARDTFARVSELARMHRSRGVWPGASTNGSGFEKWPLFEP